MKKCGYLFLFALVAMMVAACSTPAETTVAVTGTVAAGTTFMADLLGIVKPFLKPEQVAALSTKLASAQSWAEALTQGVAAVGQGIGELRTVTDATAAKAASGATQADALALAGGSVVVDRLASAAQRAHRAAKAAKVKA